MIKDRLAYIIIYLDHQENSSFSRGISFIIAQIIQNYTNKRILCVYYNTCEDGFVFNVVVN